MSSWRVSNFVMRRTLLPALKPGRALAAAGLALCVASGGACGGDPKKESTTPAPAAGGDDQSAATRPEDMDPTAGPDRAADPDDPVSGADPGEQSNDWNDAPDGGGTDGGGGKAGIEPPGLDKPADQVRAIVDRHLEEGRKSVRSGNYEDAIASARSALAEDEVNVAAMVLLAHAYYGKGYYDKAEAILDIALKRPDGASNAQLHFLFSLVYEKTERPAKALESLEKALEVRPDYKSAMLNVGAKYIGSGRFDDAIQIYERLTASLGQSRDPRAAISFSNLGAAYRGRSAALGADKQSRAEMLRKAETAYKQAATVDKNYGQAYYNLGLLYLDADPFPDPDGKDMDTLKRLDRAKLYFKEYRGMPGANFDLVDRQVGVVEKLYQREESRREKQREREEKQRKREERERKRAAEKGDDQG